MKSGFHRSKLAHALDKTFTLTLWQCLDFFDDSLQSFAWGSEPNVSISLSSNILRVYSHRDGAGDLFPAAAFPEFAAAQIIIGHHDNDALDSGPAQTHQAFIQQTLTESASLVSRLNRQMIDVSAAPIMTA